MLTYPVIVSHLCFNFLCLLLLYSFYLCGSYLAESTLWKSALLVSLLSVQDFTETSFSNLTSIYMVIILIWKNHKKLKNLLDVLTYVLNRNSVNMLMYVDIFFIKSNKKRQLHSAYSPNALNLALS
jgi:hypothetical protein